MLDIGEKQLVHCIDQYILLVDATDEDWQSTVKRVATFVYWCMFLAADPWRRTDDVEPNLECISCFQSRVDAICVAVGDGSISREALQDEMRVAARESFDLPEPWKRQAGADSKTVHAALSALADGFRDRPDEEWLRSHAMAALVAELVELPARWDQFRQELQRAESAIERQRRDTVVDLLKGLAMGQHPTIGVPEEEMYECIADFAVEYLLPEVLWSTRPPFVTSSAAAMAWEKAREHLPLPDGNSSGEPPPG